MSKKMAWEAESWEELKSLVSLDEVRKALSAREKNRLYHKIHNSKNAEILRKAKELGISAE
jgi:ribosomal protein L32E